jgi:predicted kinase
MRNRHLQDGGRSRQPAQRVGRAGLGAGAGDGSPRPSAPIAADTDARLPHGRAGTGPVAGNDVAMVTIVVSGPPATGKTTLAIAVGRALGAPVFSRDPLMDVLFDGRLGWPRLLGDWVPATALRIQTVLLARQLELGQSAILECVAPPALRQLWREMAVQAGHQFVSVECVCSDAATHRARFEQRQGRVQPGGLPMARRGRNHALVPPR